MKLTFGGKDFELKDLTLNDWIKAEDLGLKLSKLSKLKDDPEALSMKDIRTFVFIVLSRADATITDIWVGDNLSLDNMQEVMSAVGNFITPKTETAPTSS